MLYALVVVVIWLTVKGTVEVVVTTTGPILLGLYYGAIRQNLPDGRTAQK